MSKKVLLGAALAAWSSIGAAVAQQPSVASSLATAKLAESRGEIVKAKATLESAMPRASADEKARLEAELTRLRALLGEAPKAVAPAQDPEERDPVARLILTLDRGTEADPQVKLAVDQLQELGTLIDGMLVEQLPKFGPFGLHNALELLHESTHPALLPTLQKLLQDGEPAIADAISRRLCDMSATVALPLARKLADARPAGCKLQSVLFALRDSGAEDKEMLALAERMAAQPEQREGLWRFASKSEGPVGKACLKLLAEGDDSNAANARARLLYDDKDLDEARAMAEIARLPEGFRINVAHELLGTHPEWIRVAEQAMKQTSSSPDTSLLRRVEWWREPEIGMRTLLALPESYRDDRGYLRALESIANTTWILPEEMQLDLERVITQTGKWNLLLLTIPMDAEARALAAWKRAGPSGRSGLFSAVLDYERPWHNLMLTHLETIDPKQHARRSMFGNAWAGMDEAETARFVAMVRMWIERYGASPTRPSQNRKLASTNGPSWDAALIAAYANRQPVPAEALVPLIEHGNTNAWSILMQGAPHLALDVARHWSPDRLELAGRELPRLIAKEGGPGDLELAIRVVDAAATDMATIQILATFLLQHAAGDPRIIAWGKLPHPWQLDPFTYGYEADPLAQTAWRFAHQASIDDLDTLLGMLPELHSETANHLLRRLCKKLKATHAVIVSRHMTRLLDIALETDAQRERGYKDPWNRMSATRAAHDLLPHLARIDAPSAAQQASRILEAATGLDDLLDTAAVVQLEVTDDATAATREMLAHRSPLVVGVALSSTALSNDKDLQDAAVAAIQRLGDQLKRLEPFFDRLDDARRIDVAKALLDCEAFPTFGQFVASDTLAALGAFKRADLAPAIAKGSRHPDWRVRGFAAEQLGRTFSKEAAPFLIEMLRDDSPDVRTAAGKALEQITTYLDAREKWEGRIK